MKKETKKKEEEKIKPKAYKRTHKTESGSNQKRFAFESAIPNSHGSQAAGYLQV